MDMREGNVRQRITLPRRCHLLPSLPRSRTRTTATLYILRTTHVLKKVTLYLILPETDSWSPLLPLVMDPFHPRHTPSLMIFKPIDSYINHLKLRVPRRQICHPSKLGVSSPLGKLVQPLEGSSPVTTMTAKILRSVILLLCLFPPHITAPQLLLHLFRTDKHPSARVRPTVDLTTNRYLVLHTRCQVSH
jgi:hypothetical protein